MRKAEGKLSIVGLMTGESVDVVAYRHLNFLPSVAADNRSQLCKRLAYFAEKNPYLRYLVFTNGPRCGIRDLRDRLRRLHRAVSQIASEPALKHWGITFELRVSEVTAAKAFTDDSGEVLVEHPSGDISKRAPAGEGVKDGEWSYHPHANVIINKARFLADDEWREYLSWMHAVCPGAWNDNGVLKDAKEAVKYFTKPAEIIEHTPAELVGLYAATFGLHLAQTMSAFRAFALKLKDDRVKLSHRLCRDGVWRWCFVRLSTKEQKLGDAGGTCIDSILSLLSPQPKFLPRLEPCALVSNYSGQFERMLRTSNIEDYLKAFHSRWNGISAVGADVGSTPSPKLLSTTSGGFAAKRPQAAVLSG